MNKSFQMTYLGSIFLNLKISIEKQSIFHVKEFGIYSKALGSQKRMYWILRKGVLILRN